MKYPKGYSHRRGCSRQHPVPFPCDDGTLTTEARTYLHEHHLPCLCPECLGYLASDGLPREASHVR